MHAYHRALEPMLIQALKEAGLLDPEVVYLQSFEKSSLTILHDLLKKEGVVFPATWLLDCGEVFPTEEDLKDFSQIGTAIGCRAVFQH